MPRGKTSAAPRARVLTVSSQATVLTRRSRSPEGKFGTRDRPAWTKLLPRSTTTMTTCPTVSQRNVASWLKEGLRDTLGT